MCGLAGPNTFCTVLHSFIVGRGFSASIHTWCLDRCVQPGSAAGVLWNGWTTVHALLLTGGFFVATARAFSGSVAPAVWMFGHQLHTAWCTFTGAFTELEAQNEDLTRAQAVIRDTSDAARNTAAVLQDTVTKDLQEACHDGREWYEYQLFLVACWRRSCQTASPQRRMLMAASSVSGCSNCCCRQRRTRKLRYEAWQH